MTASKSSRSRPASRLTPAGGARRAALPEAATPSRSSPSEPTTWSGRQRAISGSPGRVIPVRTRIVPRPAARPIAMSVSSRSPTTTHSGAGSPSRSSATRSVIGEGLPTIGSTRRPVTPSTAPIMPAASGISPALDRARPVGVGAHEPRPVALDRLERDVELPVVERPIEGHHDVVYPGVVDRRETGRPQLLDERRLADHEAARARRLAGEVAREDVRGVDHLVQGGGHAEPRELRRVVRAALDRLVREEAHPAAGARGGPRSPRARPAGAAPRGTPCRPGRR